MSEATSGTATNEAADTQNNDADQAAATAAAAESKTDAPVDKTGEGKQDESKTDTKDDAGKKPGESEEVDYKFEMPEGIELDEPRIAEFKGIAKELGLTQEAAQKLVNLGIQREQQFIEQHRETVKGWGDEVAKHKVLGKPENQAIARKAIDTFGPEGLKQYLESTGLGNHPLLVEWAYKVGKATSEDGFIGGREGNATQPKSPEDILYGKSN